MMEGDHSRSKVNDGLGDIRRKLRESRIKLPSLIARCEKLDGNDDGLIDINDLEDLLNSLLGENRLSKREYRLLVSAVSSNDGKGSIKYHKLFEVLEPSTKQMEPERWRGSVEVNRDERWATRPGSVGNWLQRAACPAEIQNFKRLIACLETFERDSGMKVTPSADGFMVPLGPDLRASIKFTLH